MQPSPSLALDYGDNAAPTFHTTIASYCHLRRRRSTDAVGNESAQSECMQYNLQSKLYAWKSTHTFSWHCQHELTSVLIYMLYSCWMMYAFVTLHFVWNTNSAQWTTFQCRQARRNMFASVPPCVQCCGLLLAAVCSGFGSTRSGEVASNKKMCSTCFQTQTTRRMWRIILENGVRRNLMLNVFLSVGWEAHIWCVNVRCSQVASQSRRDPKCCWIINLQKHNIST